MALFITVEESNPVETMEISSDEEGDNEVSDEEVFSAYNLMHTKWIEVVDKNTNLTKQLVLANMDLQDSKKQMEKLTSEFKEVQVQKSVLQAELDHLKRNVRLLNSGTEKLDELLVNGVPSSSRSGLGFDQTNQRSQPSRMNTVPTFVKASNLPPQQANSSRSPQQTGPSRRTFQTRRQAPPSVNNF